MITGFTKKWESAEPKFMEYFKKYYLSRTGKMLSFFTDGQLHRFFSEKWAIMGLPIHPEADRRNNVAAQLPHRKCCHLERWTKSTTPKLYKARARRFFRFLSLRPRMSRRRFRSRDHTIDDRLQRLANFPSICGIHGSSSRLRRTPSCKLYWTKCASAGSQ